jgi:hypothetical protein
MPKRRKRTVNENRDAPSPHVNIAQNNVNNPKHKKVSSTSKE